MRWWRASSYGRRPGGFGQRNGGRRRRRRILGRITRIQGGVEPRIHVAVVRLEFLLQLSHGGSRIFFRSGFEPSLNPAMEGGVFRSQHLEFTRGYFSATRWSSPDVGCYHLRRLMIVLTMGSCHTGQREGKLRKDGDGAQRHRLSGSSA